MPARIVRAGIAFHVYSARELHEQITCRGKSMLLNNRPASQSPGDNGACGRFVFFTAIPQHAGGKVSEEPLVAMTERCWAIDAG